MIQAIVSELVMRKNYLTGQVVRTVYFGGGTPSVLDETELGRIMEAIYTHYDMAPEVEITLEANPDDITNELLAVWKKQGVNRLSIGVQGFQDPILKSWNRSHDARQSLTSIVLAQQAGFENITADLIYGSPALTDEDWEENIRTLTSLEIPHISCYALTVEDKTALAYQIQKGASLPVSDEQSNRQYAMLQSLLHAAGYVQYEVSNFCKPGLHSKHNTSYWSGAHYLGIGPSAHSYDGVSRQWNVSNNMKYIGAIQQGNIPFEKEVLTPEQQYNELVMTGLRTSDGIDMFRLKNLDEHFEKYLQREILSLVEKEYVYVNTKGNYALHPDYFFFADGIAAELFFSPR